MAGYVVFKDGSDVCWHTDFVGVDSNGLDNFRLVPNYLGAAGAEELTAVREIQADSDELAWILSELPTSRIATPDAGKPVQRWQGAWARRIAYYLFAEAKRQHYPFQDQED